MKTDHIEKRNYVGYVWYSDKTTPCQLSGEEEFSVALDKDNNPFIIEGQLYDPMDQVSYSIRYVDGDYLVQRWDLKTDFEDDKYTFTPKEYMAHRLLGKHTLLFRQYWMAEPDDLCLGMKVQQPHALVFVGFKSKMED